MKGFCMETGLWIRCKFYQLQEVLAAGILKKERGDTKVIVEVFMILIAAAMLLLFWDEIKTFTAKMITSLTSKTDALLENVQGGVPTA